MGGGIWNGYFHLEMLFYNFGNYVSAYSGGRNVVRSKYKAEYCGLARKYMAKGHSLNAFADSIGVGHKTVKNWKRMYPDFAAAMGKAQGKCRDLVYSGEKHDQEFAWYPGIGRGKASKYRPEYCEWVVRFLAKGHALTAFAGNVGVCRLTLDSWCEIYPEFREAVDVGKAKSQLWWENKLIDLVETGKGSINGIIYGLGNRGASGEWGSSRKSVNELAALDSRVEKITAIECVIVHPVDEDVGAGVVEGVVVEVED